jgi:hypothetical protein
MKKPFHFCLPLIAIGYWLLAIGSAHAADAYILENQLITGQTSVSGPAEYIRIFFIFGLGLVGITALFGVAFGGLNYIFSGHSQTRAMEGRHWITAALSGVALLLCSYLILATINPDLVSLKNPVLPTIEIDVPEPPAQNIINAYGSHTGKLPSQITFSNPKYPNMEQEFNEKASNGMRQAVAGLPIPVVITSFWRPNGRATSDHYNAKAIDIWTDNMTTDQIRAVMDYLNNNPAVSKTITGRLPQMNMLFGKSHDYGAKTNNDHTNHIHASFY